MATGSSRRRRITNALSISPPSPAPQARVVAHALVGGCTAAGPSSRLASGSISSHMLHECCSTRGAAAQPAGVRRAEAAADGTGKGAEGWGSAGAQQPCTRVGRGGGGRSRVLVSHRAEHRHPPRRRVAVTTFGLRSGGAREAVRPRAPAPDRRTEAHTVCGRARAGGVGGRGCQGSRQGCIAPSLRTGP